MTTTSVPAGSGQKTKPPLASASVFIKTRSTPLASFCSSAMSTRPLTALPVALSTTVPLIETEVVETSPACSTGFSRYCPLPCKTMETQVLKSISRSLVSPAAMVRPPLAIWPGGILMPVVDSLESCRVWTVPSLSTTQLAAPLVHRLVGRVLLTTDGLLSDRMIRICWYLPGCNCCVEPSEARKHWFEACPRRSICCGLVDRPGVRSTKPGSLSAALPFTWALTSVTVTKTWANGPLGAMQVEGSLSLTDTWAMPADVLAAVPLQPAINAAIAPKD